MPYSKSKSRKRSSKPKYWYDRKYSAGELAQYAIRGVKQLKGIINSEKKNFTVAISASPTTTPIVTHLTAIGQGDTNVLRNGNSLLAKSIYLNVNCIHNSAGGATQLLRAVIVRDKQQVGDTSPAFTDVFTSATVSALLDINTFPGRFQILYDKQISLNSGSSQSVYLKKYLRMSTHIKYNGTASTDIAKNGLYLMIVGNQATNVPTVTGNVRLMYYDN